VAINEDGYNVTERVTKGRMVFVDTFEQLRYPDNDVNATFDNITVIPPCPCMPNCKHICFLFCVFII
jgi:hypothetical protein